MDLSKLNIKNQIEYFKALHEESDPKKKREIAEKLFLINRNLVFFVANRINITEKMKLIDKDDIYDWGDEGLIKAIEKFDFTRGFEFSTFARRVIKSSILHELEKNNDLTENEENLEAPLKRKNYDREATLADIISDNENHYEDLVDRCFKESLIGDIKKYLSSNNFTDNERKILNLNLTDMNDVEIGKELGVTRARIGYIRNKTLNKLRECFQSKNDPDLSF